MKPQVSTTLEKAFNLVNCSDKTDHEPELTKNSATFFSTIIKLVCTLLTKGTVFSCIFKNKKRKTENLF